MRETVMIITSSLIILFTGCAPDRERTVFPDRGFSIAIPQEWDIQKDFMSTAMSASLPLKRPDDTFRESLNVVIEEDPGTEELDKYVHMNLESLQQVIPELEVIEKGNLTIDGSKFSWIEYRFSREGLHIHAITFLSLHGERGFSINATADETDFKARRDLFFQTAKSFRFEDR